MADHKYNVKTLYAAVVSFTVLVLQCQWLSFKVNKKLDVCSAVLM